MGKVASVDEIETNMVARLDDFPMAQDIFTEMSDVEIDRGNISGAFIFGSVAVGSCGRRSDFDAIICIPDAQPARYSAARAITQEINHQTSGRIPNETYVYTEEVLKQRRHTYDRFFGQHLTGPDRIVCGERDPAGIIRFNEATRASDILGTYLNSKRRRLSGAFNNYDALDLSNGGIQRMLELPNAIGRKVLQTLAEEQEAPEFQIRSVDKNQVMKKALRLFVELGVDRGYLTLVGANAEYSELLESAVDGLVTRREYEDEIRRLHASLPQAIQWVDQVQDAVMPLFKSA